ncbi:MAG TPA: hypothetical protein VFF79_12665 [Conexibacter sp.]|jgi:hypothetical protein|nr:hypothetical protein [Conexibacter sp.]
MDASQKPFPQAIDDARGTRTIQDIAWHLEGLVRSRRDGIRQGASRSSFEKHAAGTARGAPSAYLMERVAEVLGIDPAYFAEYRLAMARHVLDERGVGFEAAVANLAKVRQALGLEPQAPPAPGEDEETLRLAAGEEIELPGEQDADTG